MKKVIGRKVYDTEKATFIHGWENRYFPGDFYYCEESLYMSEKGNFFIVGSGGAKSKYAKASGISWGGSNNNIIPLSKEEVIEWLEKYEGSEKILELFPDELEDA